MRISTDALVPPHEIVYEFIVDHFALILGVVAVVAAVTVVLIVLLRKKNKRNKGE